MDITQVRYVCLFGAAVTSTLFHLGAAQFAERILMDQDLGDKFLASGRWWDANEKLEEMLNKRLDN